MMSNVPIFLRGLRTLHCASLRGAVFSRRFSGYGNVVICREWNRWRYGRDNQPIHAFKRLGSPGYSIYLALPYMDDAPAECGQLGLCPAVALDVAAYLLLPEVDVGFRQAVVAASLMAVPETTVY